MVNKRHFFQTFAPVSFCKSINGQKKLIKRLRDNKVNFPH